MYARQHEALISKETWEAVKAKQEEAGEEVLRRTRNQRPRMVYPLSGVLHFGRCGRKVMGGYGIKQRKIYR